MKPCIRCRIGNRELSLGRVVATPGALAVLEKVGVEVAELLSRHQRGDWGDVSPEDFVQNETAMVEAMTILSIYTLPTGERVWVLTAWDRSLTTVLLPSDY